MLVLFIYIQSLIRGLNSGKSWPSGCRLEGAILSTLCPGTSPFCPSGNFAPPFESGRSAQEYALRHIPDLSGCLGLAPGLGRVRRGWKEYAMGQREEGRVSRQPQGGKWDCPE